MAIGGMIGGGIFSVLGLTIDLAGHLAFAAFLIGGLIAGLTAHAYSVLSLRAGRAAGPFTYLRDEGHTRPAAWVAWLLIVGYVFALAVYAFTIGHYLANVVGAPATVARLSGVGILPVFVAVNLRGVATSGLTEDIVVVTNRTRRRAGSGRLRAQGGHGGRPVLHQFGDQRDAVRDRPLGPPRR